jgi:hypothetical protein
MKFLYFAAAVIGAIVPYVFFIQHAGAYGFGLAAFVTAVLANPAASGFTSDLLISSVVFWAFMFHRNRFAHGPKPLAFIALNLFIGLSCALPAYLYAQERGRRSPSKGIE